MNMILEIILIIFIISNIKLISIVWYIGLLLSLRHQDIWDAFHQNSFHEISTKRHASIYLELEAHLDPIHSFAIPWTCFFSLDHMKSYHRKMFSQDVRIAFDGHNHQISIKFNIKVLIIIRNWVRISFNNVLINIHYISYLT